MNNPHGKPIEGEIITPAQLDRILGQSREPDIPHLDAVIERFEQLFGQSVKTLDLDSPEGWIGELFGGIDHRISVKTERGQALFGLVETFVRSLDQFEEAEKKIRALNRERYELYIDRIRAARTALEEQQKLAVLVANTPLQCAVDEARMKADIAAYGAMAEKARLSALPPAPPPPAPTPVDEATRKREATRRRVQDEIDTKLDEQAAWSAASEESVARARSRCIEIYRELNARDGDKRARIQRVLEHYNLDASILPVAIEELILRGYEEVDQ